MVGRGPYNKIRLDPLKPETYAHPTYNIISFNNSSNNLLLFICHQDSFLPIMYNTRNACSLVVEYFLLLLLLSNLWVRE